MYAGVYYLAAAAYSHGSLARDALNHCQRADA